MDDWLFSSLATGFLITLGWLFFTRVVPRKAAERAAKPYEQRLSTLPDAEDQQIVTVDADTTIASTKHTHDVFLSEADELILGARGAGLFAENLFAEAAEKIDDAIKLRPGSYNANVMAGEVAYKRAMLAQGADGIPLLEAAAVYFARASEAKKGVIDTYVGRAWAHLERAQRLEGDAAAAAYLDSAEVFLKGFRVSPQNLFILRGWGIAIDGMARTIGDGAPPVIAAEESYRLALAEHRGGDHELHRWFAEIRAAEQPTVMEMPAVRDRY